MKLKHAEDKQMFLTDIDRLDLLESSKEFDNDVLICDELLGTFLQRRTPLLAGLKDYRRSKITKDSWRTHRFKYISGIKKFHRSIEGRRFHRNLGRFIATRIFRDKKSNESFLPVEEVLKAVANVRTYLYLEACYYRPLSEDVEFREFVEYIVPILHELETSLFTDANFNPSEEVLEALARIVEVKELEKAISKYLDKTVDLSLLKDKQDKEESLYFLETIKGLA